MRVYLDEFRLAHQRICEATAHLEPLRGHRRMLAEKALASLAEARIELEQAIAAPDRGAQE